MKIIAIHRPATTRATLACLGCCLQTLPVSRSPEPLARAAERCTRRGPLKAKSGERRISFSHPRNRRILRPCEYVRFEHLSATATWLLRRGHTGATLEALEVATGSTRSVERLLEIGSTLDAATVHQRVRKHAESLSLLQLQLIDSPFSAPSLRVEDASGKGERGAFAERARVILRAANAPRRAVV